MRKFKDSGIEWIGKIPTDWESRKIKFIATLNGRIGWQGLTSNEYCDSGAYLITGVNFKNGEIDWSTCVHVPMERWEEATQIQIENGDLLITKDGTVGKVAIVSNMPAETSLNSGVLLIRTTDACYKKFLFWILQSEIFWKWFNTINAGNSTITHLYQYDFCNFSFPFPPYNKQCQIADYLDCKCSQIDAIIAKQQEVIEKLKEYKLSLITEAVTKGLNPDVPMKDSGVDWIGKIPEHWDMVRLKFLLSQIIDCPHETPIYSSDGNYLVIRTADQELGKLRTDKAMYRLNESEYLNRIRRMPLEKDDIVYGREGERWGLACLVPESNKYCLGQRMLQFRCKSELFLPSFAMWTLNSKFIYLQGAIDMIGSTSPHVNISTVRNFLIPLPRINEQQKIVEYVEKKMFQLNKEIEQREILICKLNEYKKSLIYEIVTGKKEV